MDTAIKELLISINELLISINELFISINKLLISIKMDAVSIFIDINKYGLNVKTAAHRAWRRVRELYKCIATKTPRLAATELYL